MLITFEALIDFAETIAAIALLALAFGSMHRWFVREWLASLVLGVLFGLGAALAMFHPLTPQPGIIIDLRSVPVALAATYLRPAGALTALAIAISMRLSVGGVGMVPGIFGIAVSFSAALALGRVTKRSGSRSLPQLLVLAVACSSGIAGLLLLPADFALDYLARIGPTLVVCNSIGFIIVAKIIEREQKLIHRESELLQASITDPLTRLLNRRGFEDAYRCVLSDRRARPGSALMLLDMDHFKAVNDTHGHEFGDLVLREVALRLGVALRQCDLIGRFGGEEMVIYMAGLTRIEAQEAARRICHDISQNPISRAEGGLVRVTASIGVYWSATPADLTAGLSSADQALYAAKRDGRDRFVMAA